MQFKIFPFLTTKNVASNHHEKHEAHEISLPTFRVIRVIRVFRGSLACRGVKRYAGFGG